MLADARAKGYTQFDKIILVGGATRMPQVHNRLVAEFNVEPEIYDPDEAVAKGAALYALKESLAGPGPGLPRDPGRRRMGSRPSRSTWPTSPRKRSPRPSTTWRSSSASP